MQETKRDSCSIPGSRRSPGGGHGNPTPCPCLENPMDRGAWWATVHGVAKGWTRPGDFHFSTPRVKHRLHPLRSSAYLCCLLGLHTVVCICRALFPKRSPLQSPLPTGNRQFVPYIRESPVLLCFFVSPPSVLIYFFVSFIFLIPHVSGDVQHLSDLFYSAAAAHPCVTRLLKGR